MKDKEMIEEINDIISEEYNNGNDNWYSIAEIVYDKLFPENSVVLSKENYDKLCHLAYFGYNEHLNKINNEKRLEEFTFSKKIVEENQQLKDRIAELEGEITKSDIINSKLEMDIELLNKQNIDLEIDRDYYQEQFNEQEDFYVEWNNQQLEQFAERLKEKKTKRLIPVGLDQPAKEVWFIKLTEEEIDETLKEFINKGDEER